MFKRRQKPNNDNESIESLSERVKAKRRAVITRAKQNGDHEIIETMMQDMLSNLTKGGAGHA